MEGILFIIKLVLSISLPLWAYYWLSDTFKKQPCSKSASRYEITSVNFLLKRWWAECSLGMKKKKNINSNNCKRNDLENSRITDNDSTNSLLFYAADQTGNSLFIKFSHRGFKTVEASLHLATSDGRLYVLPGNPDTTLVSSFNQEWTAAGLKIEMLESQQRWRLVYNGMLRNLAQGGECSDENVEHIRLNFLFIVNSEQLKWPADWSHKLHADALAREPWRSPNWMNKIKLLDYTGVDHFGSMLGQVTYKDGSVCTLYLRGLHQHRWGKHESHEFHKSVTLFGVMSSGAIYYLNGSSTKHSFPQLLCGQFRDSSEQIFSIDGMEIKLSDFTQEKLTSRSESKMWFTARGKEYNILAKPESPLTLYYGQPWNWVNTIATVKLELNGKLGIGLIQLCHPYDEPCQAKTPVKLRHLKQVHAHVERTDYVLHFDDEKCRNENIVGGKGFSLAMLSSIEDTDFIVPGGFCVTVFAFELQLHTHKALQKMINDIEDVSVGKKDGDLQKYCEEAVRIIQSTPIVDEVKDAILKAIENLESLDDSDKPHRYAIRSSAVGEDSEETSAAGQNSTYLGIEGADNIIKSVTMCWASLFSYQSVKYRKQHGLFVKASMGVCVQKMVNADAAGVMFTRHPTTGDPSNLVITSNYGLGETVVSAAVEPDTIVVHKSWNNKLTIKSSMPGNKRQKMLVGKGGVVTIELNDHETKAVCISEEISLRLAAIGLDLETLFSSARDVEWAVIGEKIYLLQARPITTLYAWTDFELTHELDCGVPGDSDLITFANVGEVFPNPISPLTHSMILKAFNAEINKTYGSVSRQFFYTVGMRVAMNYYNMFLRDPRKEIVILNKVAEIALCGEVVITPEIHRIGLERNGEATASRRIAMLYRMLMDAVWNSKVEKRAKEICADLILKPEEFHTAYSLYNEINRKYPVYVEATGCHMHTSRVSVSFQILAMALLMKGYKDFVPDHFTDIAILFGSCSDLVGTEVLTGLKKIVNYVKKSEKEEEFKKLDPKKVIDWLKVNCPLGAKELEKFLEEHGHRCIQEMDFLAEPWSLKPENLVVMLQTLIMSSNLTNANKTITAADTVASLKTPKSAVTKAILEKLVPLSRKAVVRREMTKSLFVSVVHKFRLAIKKLGELMVLEEYLPSEDLVFFLTNEEIGQVLTHRNTTLIQKASRRRRIFPRLKEQNYTELNIGMPIPMKDDLEVAVTDGCVKIQGTPVCCGSVMNRACVITDISDAHQIQHGDILITHATDIAWSPYFPLLSGVVTEMGGLISHGAVVAREYGLPCIIGAKKATRTFQTGDTVLLAADTGVLQLVKKLDQEKA